MEAHRTSWKTARRQSDLTGFPASTARCLRAPVTRNHQTDRHRASLRRPPHTAAWDSRTSISSTWWRPLATMPRMALDWQEGGPNPSASPTASLAAILGQIPTGLTEPWPPPVLICALAVLLPSPLLLLLLQIPAGSGPQNTFQLWRFYSAARAADRRSTPAGAGWTHSSGATDAPEWRAVVCIGDLLRGAVCSRVHVGALGATHDANMVR